MLIKNIKGGFLNLVGGFYEKDIVVLFCISCFFILLVLDIGTKNANQLAIFDMSGNVWEYCWDWSGDYPTISEDNYTGQTTGTSRIVRGGSCINESAYLQIGYRDSFVPKNGSAFAGFRVARSNP